MKNTQVYHSPHKDGPARRPPSALRALLYALCSMLSALYFLPSAFCLLCFLSAPHTFAAAPDEPVGGREEEIEIKQKRIDELTAEITVLRKHIEDEKAAAGTSAAAESRALRPKRRSSGSSGVPESRALRPKAGKVRPEYYVEIGDVLDIDVWRVPDISRSVTVRPDGRISMPLVGDLDVSGINLVEMKQLVTRKLSEYVRSPQVAISIRQFGGRKFIVLGEIGAPGVYRFQQEISLLEGIALAGGFKPDARRGKIMVIRGDIHREPQVKIISANLEKVLRQGMLSENLTILPNDIIFVGKDFLGDYNDVIKDLVEPSLDSATNFFITRSAIRTAQDRRN